MAFWSAVMVLLGLGSASTGAPRAPPLALAGTQEWRAEAPEEGLELPASLAGGVFVWPKPLPELPRMEYSPAEPTVSPEVIQAWRLRSEPDLAAEMGEALFRGPEILLDRLMAMVQALAPRPRLQTLPPPGQEGIHARILELHREPRPEGPFLAFLHEWASREQRYFSRFEDSRATSVGFESGTEDAELDEFEDDQRKLLWDALRNVTFSRYRFRPEERIREDAFYASRWRGTDFALLPPLIGGYLWVRGLERRFSVGGTSLRVSIEPISRWATQDDLETGAAFEWSPSRRIPFSAIVLAGLEDGNAELGFIGIGTSFGMARKAIRLQDDE